MKIKASWARVAMFAAVALVTSICLLPVAFHHTGTKSPLTAASHSPLAVSGTPATSSQHADARWVEAYGKLPLAFEKNEGQTDSRVRFISRGGGYQLFLTSDEAVLSLRRSKATRVSPLDRFARLRAAHKGHSPDVISVVRMHLDGANAAAQIEALNQLPGKSDYYIGDDPKNWRTDVPSFATVKYHQVYPGVDLIFYGNQRRLEYDFVVAPGADPKAIALNVQSARRLCVNAQGNVVLSVPAGEVELQKPAIYQEANGERREIAGNYALSGNNRISFALGKYDRSQPLVIDPILSYSTYLGGNSDDAAYGIAVDSSGNSWVAGYTNSTNFPSAGTQSNPPAAFVAQLNPGGTALLYSAYLAGTTPGPAEGANAIALDGLGDVFVTGTTYSADFPTLNGLTAPASTSNGVAFVSAINLSKSPKLYYSTLLGGTGGDAGLSVAADASSNAYVTGVTASTDFPLQGSITATLPSTSGNAFVARIDTTKTGTNSLIYSTYLGGTGAGDTSTGFPYADEGFGIAVDSSQNAYVVGITTSTDFPTMNGLVSSPFTAAANQAAFVSKVNTAPPGGASSLVYSTYLAGSTVNSDYGNAVALGPGGIVYVTGTTLDPGFPAPLGPTAGAFQTTYAALGRAFITLLDTSKSGSGSLKYSTYLGGTNGETGNGIQVDATGNAYVVGGTASSGLPPAGFPVTSGALQQNYPGNVNGDAFVTKLNPAGGGTSDLVYATFFGGGNGTFADYAGAIAIDASTPLNVYITGSTSSSNLPVWPNPGALQTTLNGTSDAFVAKMALQPTVTVSPLALPFGSVVVNTASAPLSVTVTNNTGSTVPYTLALTGANPGDFAAAPGGASPCPAGTLAASATPCTINVTFTPTVTPPGAESATLNITYTLFGIQNTQAVTLTGTGIATPVISLSPTSLTFPGQVVTSTSASQPVALTSTGGIPGLSVSVTGDFAETNTCTVTSTSCTINVTFTPTATGTRTGMVTVTYTGGSQSVNLTGTGWDFGVSAPGTITVKQGKTGTLTLTVTPLSGFDQAVTVACSGTIPKGSCTVSPGSVTPADGVTPVTATVTISTLSSGGIPIPVAPMQIPRVPMRQVIPLFMALVLMFILPVTRRHGKQMVLAGAVLALVLFAGCSGHPETPKGNYTLTLTGTASGVTHTTSVTLTVD
jgi:hypothetical protein